jgi:predicted phosphodiesterase
MGKLLLTSDLHLDDRTDHEYRWRVFKKLAQRCQRGDVDAIVIAGDLVDIKDRHPATFVDRLTNTIAELPYKAQTPVHILKGNHDYVEPTCPFFGFLDRLPDVTYYTEPAKLECAGPEAFLIPHTSWAKQSDWRRRWTLKGSEKGPWNVIIAHQTFNGAKASNGFELEGVPLRAVNEAACNGTRVLAGDIHVPQKIGNVTYIGSPHPVAFGDMFEPRFVLWDREERKLKSQRLAGLRRLVLNYRFDGAAMLRKDGIELHAGDHVKVRVHAHASHVGQWPEQRQLLRTALTRKEVRVFGMEFIAEHDDTTASEMAPVDLQDPLGAFGKAHDIDARLIEAGRKYLCESQA